MSEKDERTTVKVTFNYNGNMVKHLAFPLSYSSKQIDDILKKKYGIYDIKDWVVVN